ncbi:MAG: hypothetical protein ACI9VN_000948 [Patescibacteria group bacterium]|jgi:hypothetical protein
MKKEQLTDRIIRNKLKYHASASPDHLWEAIEAELPVDDKNRGIFWWMGGGFLCLALLSASFFYFSGGEENGTSTSIVNARTNANSNAATNLASDSNAEEVLALANTKEEEEISTTKTSDESYSNLAIAKSTVKPKRNTETNTNVTTLSSRAKTTANKKTVIFSDAQATDKNVEASNRQTGETKVSTKATFDIAAIKATSLTALDLSSKEILFLNAEEKELDWPSLLQDPKCATFGKWLKLHFYGDAYVSPDIAFRELESKEEAFDRYAADRRSTESQLLSFSTGLRFSVVSNYGLSARTGIVYSQINEKFEYQQERTEKVFETVEINGVIISSDTTIQSGTQYITTYNRYRMLDVPLLLGYEVNFKKFSLSVNSGVYANLVSRQQGDFLSPEDKPVTFSSDARNTYPAFRKRLNFSVYGSIAMYINLDEHWQFMMEPHMRYYLDPMTQSSYEVEQKYITAGLITGLRYRF